ncbi:hypothetical protein [Microbacterium hydrocarbonoxydans]|uniref:hypothetical protein n=1 Tax=Microbacterium hydrocarbonoxydans TaxID=273678 RepID=UPI003D991B12
MSASWWRDDAVPWSADGWSLVLRGDELAEIRHHDVRLLRAVRVAIRDRGWRTVPVAVTSVDSDSHSLTLNLRHEGLGARISSTLRVEASRGELRIRWEGVSESAFDTCRVGLVVLHPASHAGLPVVVTHSDGSTEASSFPVDISPHQPVTDIRELRIGGTVLQFDGDVFEMEDQRNWSDASFKTYSRPLELPYPYRIGAGEVVRQSLAIRHDGRREDAAREAEPTIDLRPGGAFPAVGVEVSTAPSPVAPSTLGSHRVVELDLRTPTWGAALQRAASDRLPLDVRLVTDGDAAVLEGAVRALNVLDVLRVTAVDDVSHVSDDATVALLRAAEPAAAVMGGTRSHFTELNREQHRIPADVDGIVLTTTPLFHSIDTEQLVEAVAIQRLLARQSVRIAAGRPVHIGPVSLRPRFNNVATTPEPAPGGSDLAEGFGAEFTGETDRRQSAPELAAWVIASAAALAVPGVSSLSWFETSGPRGVEGTPAEDAVAALAALGGGELLTGDSPDGLVWAIGARHGGVDTLLAANLDRRERTFRLGQDHDATVVSLLPGTWTRLTRR